MRSKRLPGLAILCIADGTQVGRIKGPVVDPESMSVVAFELAKSPFGARKLLPMDAVHSLGSHAVTVPSDQAIRSAAELESLEPLIGPRRVRVVGAPVITEGGTLIGTVKDYEVGVQGRIDELIVAQSFWKALAGGELSIAGKLLRALGKDAAIVHDDVLNLVAPIAKEAQREAGASRLRPSTNEGRPADGHDPHPS